MKKVFLTFADSRMHRSLKRIARQAKSMEIYDEIISINETNLYEDYYKKNINRLVIGSRGYGYWSWKPQIILQTLENIEYGDIVQYSDAGCHLNPKGRQRLKEYFDIADRSYKGILAFQAKVPEAPLLYDGRQLPDLSDYKWTKGDVIDYFNVRNNNDILFSPTIGAGVLFIKKCNESISIIKNWAEVFEDNFNLIDDTPSISANIDGYIEGRHDQAILSILCKINNIETLSLYEFWYPSNKNYLKPDWKSLSRFPIHQKRDKDIGFVNRLKKIPNSVKRIFNQLKH